MTVNLNYVTTNTCICTKKSLQETQWVENNSEEAFVFFDCLFIRSTSQLTWSGLDLNLSSHQVLLPSRSLAKVTKTPRPLSILATQLHFERSSENVSHVRMPIKHREY